MENTTARHLIELFLNHGVVRPLDRFVCYLHALIAVYIHEDGQYSDYYTAELNRLIQQAWNPPREGVQTISYKGKLFRSGDKVLITKNDSRRGCWNGDIGTLVIDVGDKATEDPEKYRYGVLLDRGRFPQWYGDDSLDNLELGYAITVHKAQGSEFDDVLMPLTMDSSRMLYRNMLYTATSRARRRVTLFGSRNAVDVALRSFPPRRRSMLVAKTRMRMERP